MEKERTFRFWDYDEKGKVKILHSKLLEYLENNGFAQVKLSDTNYILVREIDKRITMSSTAEVDQIIKWYLKSEKAYDVYETFAKGIGSYFSQRKENLLPMKDLVNDRDTQSSSNFYYQNSYCKVTKDKIEILEYKTLKSVIWNDRIIKRNYFSPKLDNTGQFERFCSNITGNSDVRFLGLKTILGYLLHRNKEVGEPKAIIFYDEKMGQNNQAHGGTGKTLLSQAIAKCREVEIFDGKEIKAGNYFKNQRIELTTDVLVYDDLNKNVRLENFYTMITSGVEVEKKRKQAFYIDYIDSPKILITSNYYVKGPGGSSDERRRHEFELSNYYNADFTPEIDFGNRFFGNNWDHVEWNRFFHFMMGCVQEYLKHGLMKIEPINLGNAKLNDASCEAFVQFAKDLIPINEWVDKREIESMFKELNPDIDLSSPHIFKKWLDAYAMNNGGYVEQKSSGGKYLFIIRKEVQDA